MTEALLLGPVVVPLATAVLLVFCRRRRRVQRQVSVAGSAALAACALALLALVRGRGIQVVHVGSWPAPFGIVFVGDLLSVLMVALAAIVGLATAVHSLVAVDGERERHGFHPLLHILVMGVCGAFLTGDVFNLYVWFEVLLIASFVLLALGGGKAQMEAALKYVAINLVASALLLTAVGILYGLTGSLNLADLAVRLDGAGPTPITTAVAMLFFVAFGIKAAVFPLFFWLPAAYPTLPVAVSALFAGLLTKVGVYAMIRVFTLLFVGDTPFTHGLILWVAGLTMVTGVLGAVSQTEVRRILSFHIVSQIGYMVMGLGLYTPLGLAGSVFYIAHHIVVKTNLFLIAGLLARARGSFELARLGSLWHERPWLAALFLVPALSLAGLPPLSGFFAKVVLARAGLESGEFAVVAVAFAVSLLTLYSMTKIWSEAFWKRAPGPARDARFSPALVGPSVALAGLTLAIGILAGPLLDLSIAAAEGLLDRDGYTHAVLGER